MTGRYMVVVCYGRNASAGVRVAYKGKKADCVARAHAEFAGSNPAVVSRVIVSDNQTCRDVLRLERASV